MASWYELEENVLKNTMTQHKITTDKITPPPPLPTLQ